MLEGLQNTYTLPTLGLLFALAGFAAVALTRRPGNGPVLGSIGCLLLFGSLHRYGTSPGSGSGALQLLLFCCLLVPTVLALFNNNDLDAAWLPWTGGTVAVGHLALVALPWASWTHGAVAVSLPQNYLLTGAQLALVASSTGSRALSETVTGINLLHFSWLLFFGIGTMGGLPAEGGALPSVASAIGGLGLGALYGAHCGSPLGRRSKAMLSAFAPALLLSVHVAWLSESALALFLSTATAAAGFHLQQVKARSA